MSIESYAITYKRIPPYKYQTVNVSVFLTNICPKEDISHEYFCLSKDGCLTINEGYAWDGPSGPTFDTKDFMRGSLAHDVFYQMHQLRLGLPSDWKEKADRLLVRLTREDGMSSIRCAWVYQSVKYFGRGLPRDLNQYAETLVAP